MIIRGSNTSTWNFSTFFLPSLSLHFSFLSYLSPCLPSSLLLPSFSSFPFVLPPFPYLFLLQTVRQTTDWLTDWLTGWLTGSPTERCNNDIQHSLNVWRREFVKTPETANKLVTDCASVSRWHWTRSLPTWGMMFCWSSSCKRKTTKLRFRQMTLTLLTQWNEVEREMIS